MSATTHPLEGVSDPANSWRSESPGHEGWEGSPRPGAPNKYFMMSADTHIVEPKTLWFDRIEEQFRDRVPGRPTSAEPGKFEGAEGFRAVRRDFGPDAGPEDHYRNDAGNGVEQRLLDQRFDGVDREIVYPNRGLMCFGTRDPEFALAQARVYNDWVHETLMDHWDRFIPMAIVPACDVDLAVAEVQRVAAKGFRGVLIPLKPVFGPETHEDIQYNLPMFDPLWATIAEIGFPAVFHTGTARDPRLSHRAGGGAVINAVWGGHTPCISVATHLCASGVFDRHPELRFAIIEAGVSWVPWTLEFMDQIYKKHHMWVEPKLKHGLPSEYFYRHGRVSFEEDAPGMALVEELGLVDNFLWANDYPHNEGTWPHSSAAIEREMGKLTETTRRKLLGENAARLWSVEPRPVE